MKLRILLLVLFALMAVSLTHARSQDGTTGKLEFEVASVKPNISGTGYRGGCHGIDGTYAEDDIRSTVPLGRCRIVAACLSHLIAVAYPLQFGLQNLHGGPGWVKSCDRFDVEGKADNPSETTESQLLAMLQNLLKDRFQLEMHRETRLLSGFEMVVANHGLKIAPSRWDGEGSLRLMGAAISKLDAVERRNLDQNTILGRRVSMAQLSNALSNLPGGSPVIDKTGLEGLYDFKLSWEPGEAISSVLQEQLGLKLEPKKVPVEFLIIDSAERPVAN